MHGTAVFGDGARIQRKQCTHPVVMQMIHRSAPGLITGSQLVELQAEVT